MIISKQEYERIERSVIHYIDNHYIIVTAADVSKNFHRGFPFCKKILEKLVKENKIKKHKYADRTFYGKNDKVLDFS